MYNPQVGRSVRKIGFIAAETSVELPVDGKPSIVGRFLMDDTALERVTNITGIKYKPDPDDLPPILYKRLSKNLITSKQDLAYAS